jgi:hypothetical protein
MQRFFSRVSGAVFCLAAFATAQNVWPSAALAGNESGALPGFVVSSSASSTGAAADVPVPSLSSPVVLPRMGPEFALQVYRNRVSLQNDQISSYSATTVIRAELPDTQQSGEYELQRNYSAPRTLAFKAVRFTGDNFVKSNVILRLLQSEVNHVEKDDPAMNAITPKNYKFSYKGTTELQGRVVHVYQLKPREKRAGLFKGRIFLDAYTASIVRAEGRLVKSPSLFIKKIEFIQDYADRDAYTFPVHIHSEAQARVVGRAIVDIYDSDYHPVSVAVQAQSGPTL